MYETVAGHDIWYHYEQIVLVFEYYCYYFCSPFPSFAVVISIRFDYQ